MPCRSRNEGEGKRSREAASDACRVVNSSSPSQEIPVGSLSCRLAREIPVRTYRLSSSSCTSIGAARVSIGSSSNCVAARPLQQASVASKLCLASFDQSHNCAWSKLVPKEASGLLLSCCWDVNQTQRAHFMPCCVMNRLSCFADGRTRKGF